VSRVAAEATLGAVRTARASGVPVSCDLNFRRKLWRWDPAIEPGELARRTLSEILSSADVAMGNPVDLAHVAGVEFRGNAAEGGADLEATQGVAQAFGRRFPTVRWVAVTLREGCSANHNRWGAMLFRTADATAFVAPTDHGVYAPFEIANIVDRLGAGDAFAGALIYALQTPELADPNQAVRFAVAASCLAHSIKGDFNFCTRAEVEALMEGSSGGNVAR